MYLASNNALFRNERGYVKQKPRWAVPAGCCLYLASNTKHFSHFFPPSHWPWLQFHWETFSFCTSIKWKSRCNVVDTIVWWRLSLQTAPHTIFTSFYTFYSRCEPNKCHLDHDNHSNFFCLISLWYISQLNRSSVSIHGNKYYLKGRFWDIQQQEQPVKKCSGHIVSMHVQSSR